MCDIFVLTITQIQCKTNSHLGSIKAIVEVLIEDAGIALNVD